MRLVILAIICLVHETTFALPDACSENVEISEDCACSNTFCGVNSTCINGTTCTPACNENVKISEECMCSNELCEVTSSCINGTTCMPACTENAEISEDCVCSNEVCGANSICASGMTCAQGWEQVKNPNGQIPEFLLDCLTNHYHWISPCSPLRKYFMIFDSQGNFFREKMDQRGNIHLMSYKNKARIPVELEVLEMEGHPKYLFQLEEVAQKKGSFYIATGSGKLLVAGSQVNPNLLLREDHCGKDSSASTTETPVTIASTTTSASKEPTTTAASITTVVAKESPVTSIAISTPAPNMDYGCDQAQWRVWKVDERFLLIESVNKPGFFLNVDSATYMVQLGMPEKMTGIYTSFILNITLDRSAGRQGELGIGAEAYGDLLVHYLGRDGSQLSGYVCDHEWELQSAQSMCKHLGFMTGMPTYDGQYSNKITPEYVVSEFTCESNNIQECTFRTICGTSHKSCKTQNSMKAFGGKGFSCNSGSSTDVAGVVCGDENQIQNVIKEEVSCNRATEDNDRKSVAGMYSIQNQIKTVKGTMFENKHWSEYLLPMPMAVSLMSALLLVSSQNDRDVKLAKPSSGNWDYLKYDNVMANLIFLSNHVKNDFSLSNHNMGVIKVNSRHIQKNMQYALKNAFSANNYDYKTLLPRNLLSITEDAKKNKEKANEVYMAFGNTSKIIDELLEALRNTQSYQQIKNVDIEQSLNMSKTLHKDDQEEYEAKKLEKSQYDANVTQSRKAFFEAAMKAMNTSCVNGEKDCNNCTWVEPKRVGCKTEKERCIEWHEPECLQQDKICTGGYVKECAGTKSVCITELWGLCHKHEDQCVKWNDRCTRWENFCKQNRPDSKCKKWRTPPVCTEYEYDREKAGSYCQDSGNEGLCTKCDWTDEVSKTLKNVDSMTLKLQQSVLNGENSYSGVVGVIEKLVTHINIIDKDVQNYNEFQSMNVIDEEVQNYNESQSINIIDEDVQDFNESQSTKMEQKANRNIKKKLMLVKLKVNMDINLLSPLEIPIAKDIHSYALEVSTFLDHLITMDRQKVGDMTEKQRKRVTTLLIQGKKLLEEANKEQAKHEVSMKKDSSASADARTGQQATILMENLIGQHKIGKRIESLSNRMSNAIRDMFKQQVEKQDIISIIEKLIQCSKHLNFLRVQWDQLRDFFNKLSSFLDELNRSIREMRTFYNDMGRKVQRSEIGETFKELLQEKIVDSMVNNIIVGRIAYYYTKIAEDGLLTKMASIGNYMQKVEDPVQFEKLKKYIQDESLMTQEKIKLEVSKEEARMNDRIMKDITSIKNEFACKLKDAVKLPKETLEIFKALEKQANGYTNILNRTSNASQDDKENKDFYDGTTLTIEDAIGYDNNKNDTNEIGDFDDVDAPDYFSFR